MIILNVATKSGKLETIRQPAIFAVNNTVPKPQFTLTTQAAQLDIRQASIRMDIDQYPCRASYGLKNATDATQDNADRGRQEALAAIGEIAVKGNRMAQISSHENAIAAMAAESTVDPTGDLELVTIDRPKVEVQITPHETRVLPGNISLDFQAERATINYQPGKVTGRMLRYPSIRFWVTENKVDMSV